MLKQVQFQIKTDSIIYDQVYILSKMENKTSISSIMIIEPSSDCFKLVPWSQ